MKIYSEKKLYIRHMSAGYICGKSICDCLQDTGIILPRSGSLKRRIDTCLGMITTGEDLPEINPLRSALSVIDEGDPLLVILHDMIQNAEITGVRSKSLFGIYEEMISYYDEKKKSDKKKNEVILCMSSMVVYTQMMGAGQALKKTGLLTDGVIKKQIKELRKRYEAGDDIEAICEGFLPEYRLPEITGCMISCLSGRAEGYVVPVGGELFPAGGVYEKRKISGKEICAVMLAVIIGITGIMGILTKEDKKEGRLRSALSQALVTAVGDMKDEKGTNQIMAGFMQQMLKQVDDDIDLTVRICDLDEHDQTMEVEAVGEYESFLGDRRRISVRRRLSF